MTKEERVRKLLQHLLNRLAESDDWQDWIDEADAISNVLGWRNGNFPTVGN